MFPGHKICQLRNNNHRLRSSVARWECDNKKRENPALYWRRSSVLVCPACDTLSFAPCLHEEADTRIFACATEAAKRPKKKISSCAVDPDVVVLVVPVSQQLWVDELRGLAKIASYRWCEIKLSCFFHSLTGCNKTSVLLGRGKRWLSFLAVTGYFVKMNSLPLKPPTDYLCIIERFITVLYGRTSKHIHEHRHG